MTVAEWVERAWRETEGLEPRTRGWYRAILDARPSDWTTPPLRNVRTDTTKLFNAILDAAFGVRASVTHVGPDRTPMSVVPADVDESRGGWATIDVDHGDIHRDVDGKMVHPDDLRSVPAWAGLAPAPERREAAVALWQRERDLVRDRPRNGAIHVQRAVVTHRPEWGKWPDTDDADYSTILAHRWEESFIEEETGRIVVVTSREWPVFSSFLRASTGEKPYRYPPHLDNSQWPSQAVVAVQREDLRALAADGVKIVLWEHAYGCYPPAAEVLRRYFPLAILRFADDAPGSSEMKTLPVAGNFHAYVHAMYLMDFATGERVADRYRGLGVDRCYFIGSWPTGGLIEWCRTNGFSLKRRVELMRASGALTTDLVYIGAVAGCDMRQGLIRDLDAAKDQLGRSVKVFGSGTKHGLLLPRVPPGGDGPIIAPHYASARFGLNVQWSSLFNTRLFDLWHMGVPQFIYDPHGELSAEGFDAGAHFFPFDGTFSGLVDALAGAERDVEAQVRMAITARVASSIYCERSHRVMSRVYFDHLDRLQ